MAIISNNKRNATIKGSNGNDNVFNSAANTTITLSAGNNTVDNTGAHVIIDTGNGNDAITNRGTTTSTNYITIHAGAGDDTIYSRSNYTSVSAGAGDDIISLVGGTHNSVDGGEGSDYMLISSGKTYVNGGAGDDTITSNSNENTLTGGKGNDIITGSIFGETFVYAVGDGNDTITRMGANDFLKIDLRKRVQRRYIGYKLVTETITSDLGEDFEKIVNNVSLSGSDMVIKIGTGTLRIQNALGTPIKLIDDHLKTAIINPNDYINNNIDENTLQGSSGNDYIENGYTSGGLNSGDNVTISAGTGKDTINNRGNSVYIDTGDGDDIVNNYSSDTTIIGAGGKDSIKLHNARASVLAGDDSDYVNNDYRGYGSYISGGAGSDTLLNSASVVAVYGEDGDDYIYNGSSGRGSTLSGGAGNDTIRNTGQNVSISAGDGDDLIYTAASGVTLSGGKGNDTLRLGEAVHIINYTAGDGDDIIYGYKSGDTLNLINAVVTSTENRGADVILTITGNDGSIGTLNLKSSKYRKLTLTTETDTVSNTFDATYPEGIIPDKAKTSVKVTAPFNGTFDLNDYVNIKNVDASDSDSSVVLIANNRGNRLYAGSGGGTLVSGWANDYLYCGDGADKFVYNKMFSGNKTLENSKTIDKSKYIKGGNDVIYNFDAAQDEIEFGSGVTVSRVAINGNAVVMYFEGGGSLKVQEARGKALTITDSSGTTSSYTFTTSYTGGLGDNPGTSASFEERSYLENILRDIKLTDIMTNIDDIIDDTNYNLEGEVNGKQSICISGTACERQSNNDLTTNEHGGALHSNIHNKVFR